MAKSIFLTWYHPKTADFYVMQAPSKKMFRLILGLSSSEDIGESAAEHIMEAAAKRPGELLCYARDNTRRDTYSIIPEEEWSRKWQIAKAREKA